MHAITCLFSPVRTITGAPHGFGITDSCALNASPLCYFRFCPLQLMEGQVIFETICGKFHKKSLKISTWLKVKRLEYASSILLNGLIAPKVKCNFKSFHRNRRLFKAKRYICNRSAFLWIKSIRKTRWPHPSPRWQGIRL